MIDGLLDDFLAETREMLDAIASELITWEREPENSARIDEIFRFVHTVKGNSGLFDFPRLQSLSHAAEEVLSAVRAGKIAPSQALVSAILCAIDRISEIVTGIEQSGSVPTGDDSDVLSMLGAVDQVKSADGLPATLTEPEAMDTSDMSIRSDARGTIRLPVALVDKMMHGVSDIVLARNELAGHLRGVGSPVGPGTPFERLSTLISEASEVMAQSRMRPIASLFKTLPRLVRDLSMQLGKDVALKIDGDQVELDREMIEAVRDPLVHMVRNALDHGIEHPQSRLTQGKPSRGTLQINAYQAGNQIVIRISDDGRGIDGNALAEKAVLTGRLPRTAANGLSSKDKLRLICLPGFSTAATVTDISGRGVGMDVVNHNIERIGGAIDIDSTPGSGTSFTLRIPLTLAITPIIVVEAGQHSFAIPRSTIDEVVLAASDQTRLDKIGDILVVRHRGRILPCISLSAALGSEPAVPVEQSILVIIRLQNSEQIALSVDRLGEHTELAVRPASPPIAAIGPYAGIALTETGMPLLVLDTAGLLSSSGIELTSTLAQPRFDTSTVTALPVDGRKVICFASAAGTEYALPLDHVVRIDRIDASEISHFGAEAITVIDGKIIPVIGQGVAEILTERIDAARVCKGDQTYIFPIGKVASVEELSALVEPVDSDTLLEGVTLIGSRPIGVMCIEKLIALRSCNTNSAADEEISIQYTRAKALAVSGGGKR